jgi:hypothetical protein
MARREDRYAGWRPRYRRMIDEDGYGLEYLPFNSSGFPELYKSDEKKFEWQKGGYTFIVPNSERRRQVIISGTSAPAYLDFLNLECGNNARSKILRFLREYGPLFSSEPRRPRADGSGFETADELIKHSRLFRAFVGRIIDGGAKGFLTVPDKSLYNVYIDMDSGELILEPDTLHDFIFLQIADVFSRGMTFKTCERCGAFMTPSRNTRIYCGNTCAKSASRAASS